MKLYGFWRSLAAFRVRATLNVKGVPFEEASIDLMRGEQFGADYRKVNPQSVLPTLEDGDGPPLFQSMAILEYLDETHPQPPLLPKKARDRARVRGLALIVVADAHPLVVPRIRNFLAKEHNVSETAREDWCRNWISRACEALEADLASDSRTGTFCHGDSLTLADICLVGHMAGAKLFQVDVSPYPTFCRVVDASMKIDGIAHAHPLNQPGAPKAA